MFRLRLAFVMTVFFGFSLTLGATIYWGSEQIATQFHRTQMAYETLECYERLSQEAYRYFKLRMDHLITESSLTKSDLNISKKRLLKAMQSLRNAAVINETHNKASELERVANLTAFLDASEYRFKEVEQLREQGQIDLAREALNKYSSEEIDIKFQPVIDAAIAGEGMNVTKAKSELGTLLHQTKWFAIVATVIAALFSLVASLFLFNGIKKPIESLMRGTNEIASGNLNYRIDLDTHDEFGYLAGHFNNMANNLDIQQDKLRQSQSELEFRVAKRTFELLELNQDLKRMDAERLELLADISHELRTPITVIRGEAEVTLRGHDKDAGEYKDALQRITELAIQLAKYVNDLLFLARNDTASLQFEWEILELSELIHQVSEDFQLMAQEHALSLSCNLPEQPIWVEGDKQRLRQVLFILGENACRYSKTNAQIVFSSWLEGNQVNISLADQGIGIPETDLDKIFERHFRSENARQTRKDGSGLGLPLAKSIIKAHKGNLQVQSTENVGSKFTISLPLLSANEDTINE
jgi:signal transduction histidine kinase